MTAPTGAEGGRPVPELASDPKRTKLLTDAMMRRFLDYLNTHRVTTYQDAFMAAHNFHRLVVVFLSQRMEMGAEARRVYFSVAAQTFASSLMREAVRLEEIERPDDDETTGPSGTLSPHDEPPPPEEEP